MQRFHVLLSLLTFVVLLTAAFQALLLGVGEFLLKRKRTHLIANRLPPLQTMEGCLFKLVWLGFILLSLVFITSLVFLDGIWSASLVEKTVLTLITWSVFLVLLLGRHFYGWRGRTAIRGTLLGMALLVVVTFSTRFLLNL